MRARLRTWLAAHYEGNRWELFSDGELIDLLKTFQVGRAIRVFTGQYEDKFVLHREIEGELRRRGRLPIQMRTL